MKPLIDRIARNFTITRGETEQMKYFNDNKMWFALMKSYCHTRCNKNEIVVHSMLPINNKKEIFCTSSIRIESKKKSNLKNDIKKNSNKKMKVNDTWNHLTNHKII